MDVNNSSQDDGANVQIWNYWSGTTQQWQIIEQETSIYQLKARHSGKCLDVSDTTNGANVRQWTCNGNESQQFLLTLADYNPVMSPDYNQEMIKIYPNPASLENISIDVSYIVKPLELTIVDINGKIIYRNDIIKTGIVKPDLNIIEGIYFVRVKCSNTTYSKKFIIQ